jgi:tetratricopeptide (TPR) repeat protein
MARWHLLVGASGFLAGVLAALGGTARAQPDTSSSGYIGKRTITLEIDDCPQIDPTLSHDQIKQRGSEHYERGETLYIQGDYDGAVREFVASYCLIPFYTLLKDIGTAYERSLDYERAIGYLERYVRAVPDDKPKEDKVMMTRRIAVLSGLKAHVFVETSPGGATIAIGNEAGIAARAKSGEPIEVTGGSYEITIERAGYETVTRQLDVKIGKPYALYVPLTPLKGELSVRVKPADARVFLGDRLIQIGAYNELVPAGTYDLSFEASGYQSTKRKIEVLPNQLRRELVELEPQLQTGRRQLIVYASIGGGAAITALLAKTQQYSLLGGLAGVGGGIIGGLQLPADLSLGTSNLTITASLTGAAMGIAGSLALTDDAYVVAAVSGGGLLLGGGLGYYLGERFEITPGEAAVINSGVLWGTTAGGLFWTSFGAQRNVGASLMMSGLAMGAVSGTLLARYIPMSRTRALLLDIGGAVGLFGGLAAAGIEAERRNRQLGEGVEPPDRDELYANFALGGLAIGLIGAAVLTRNYDAPKTTVKPTLGTATKSDGSATLTYGIQGEF